MTKSSIKTGIKVSKKTSFRRCKKCFCFSVKKDGFMRGKQRYKCRDCGYVFQNRSRLNASLLLSQKKQMWEDYSTHKQTYAELANKYRISIRTVQKRLDEYILPTVILVPRSITLLIDTTYFGDIGVMAFKDAKQGDIIHALLVANESLYDYRLGVRKLQEDGWIIEAIVSDGKRGLLGGFQNPDGTLIPTQMCQFHRVAIIRRYITKKPKIQPNKDLKVLGELLTRTDRETFEWALEEYERIYTDFLKEKTYYLDPRSQRERWRYTHKKTRSAFLSLKRNLPYLFVWYNYIHTLSIPNTTNGLEGYFSHLKSKVRLHRGLRKERKIKLILSLLQD